MPATVTEPAGRGRRATAGIVARPSPAQHGRMAKLNHVSIRVRDWKLSRDWYVAHIGLMVEFEIPERKTAALHDTAGVTLFVAETTDGHVEPTCGLFFEIDDVDETYRRLVARGV